jgi:hypothetical protein
MASVQAGLRLNLLRFGRQAQDVERQARDVELRGPVWLLRQRVSLNPSLHQLEEGVLDGLLAEQWALFLVLPIP